MNYPVFLMGDWAGYKKDKRTEDAKKEARRLGLLMARRGVCTTFKEELK